MILEIQNRSGVAVPRQYLNVFFKSVERRFSRGLQKQIATKSLLIVFVSQIEAKRLNAQFRGRSYATDVLSFAPSEPDSLGELVMSPHVLKRQAREHGMTFRDEVAYMVLHGLLHLLGFDHETNERDAKKMFRLQDDVFWKVMSGFRTQKS